MSFQETFKETCDDMGGEIKDFPQESQKVCVIEDEGMALTQDGEMRPID